MKFNVREGRGSCWRRGGSCWRREFHDGVVEAHDGGGEVHGWQFMMEKGRFML